MVDILCGSLPFIGKLINQIIEKCGRASVITIITRCSPTMKYFLHCDQTSKVFTVPVWITLQLIYFWYYPVLPRSYWLSWMNWLCFTAHPSCTPTRGQSNTGPSRSHSDHGSAPADCRGPTHSPRGIHRAAFTWAPALSLHWETQSDSLCSESTPQSSLDRACPIQTKVIPTFGSHSISSHLTDCNRDM